MTTALPAVSVSKTQAHKAKADLLAVGLIKDRVIAGQGITATVAKELRNAATAVQASTAEGAVARVPAPGSVAATAIVFVGLGDGFAELSALQQHETLRRAAGSVTRSVTHPVTVALALPTPSKAAAEAVATGAVLGAYRYTTYLSKPETRQTASALVIVTDKAHAQNVQAGQTVGAAVARARDLVNQPPLDLYPESFAQTVQDQAKDRKVKVTVYDDVYLKKNGYGGLTGVGQGSPRGPRLVKVEYSPKGADLHLALVGKGITFDSGGLSLKPAMSMEDMKSDMAGAAAAVQSLFGIADLGLKVKVTAWLCLAENMPSGSAQRPSDVIHILGGKTVEVTNTDAEGRLVLADGLVAAQADKPDLLIDIATLTGAQIVALGSRYSGVMGSEAAREKVVDASLRSGENMWAMPFPEEIRSYFDSTVADLKNAGKRNGGMLAAGIFLSEFVAEDTQWAHIDIAGPSYNTESPWGYTPTAATGVPVRTLIEVAQAMAK